MHSGQKIDQNQAINNHRMLFTREPLNKSHAGATAALRDGMHERREREWLTPFASSLTPQTARKALSRMGCGKIGCFLCCPPWPRHQRRCTSYDLRRAPCAAPERRPSERGQRRRTRARDREQWCCYGSLHCAATLAQRCASHPDFASSFAN